MIKSFVVVVVGVTCLPRDSSIKGIAGNFEKYAYLISCLGVRGEDQYNSNTCSLNTVPEAGGG